MAVVDASASARPRRLEHPQRRSGDTHCLATRTMHARHQAMRITGRSPRSVWAHEAFRTLTPKNRTQSFVLDYSTTDYDHSRMRASVRISNAFETAAAVEMTSWRLKKEKKKRRSHDAPPRLHLATGTEIHYARSFPPELARSQISKSASVDTGASWRFYLDASWRPFRAASRGMPSRAHVSHA